MTEEQLAAEAEPNTPPAEAGFSLPENEETQGQEQTPERDWETEARDMGWVDKDTFKGDPDKWTDAKSFVERGETFIPFLQADRRKLQEKLDAKEKEMAERIARIEKAADVGLKAAKAQHEAEIKRINDEMRKAVKAGDTAAFDALDKQRDELNKSAPDSEPATQTEDQRNAYAAEWAKKNEWFNSDFDLNEEAQKYHVFLNNSQPGLTIEENLEKVAEHVKQKYPEKFGAKPSPAPRPSAVDGGSPLPPMRDSKAKTFANMPKEYRDAFENTFKNKGVTKEAYVAAYYEENAQ